MLLEEFTETKNNRSMTTTEPQVWPENPESGLIQSLLLAVPLSILLWSLIIYLILL